MVKRLLVSDEDLEELIHQYCRDFTELAREGRYDPITGRDKEIDQTILILLQKGRKNCCYLAPAGVGKTALVVGLAQKIASGDVPEYLKNARVIEIDMPSLAAGTESNAQLQERFIPICRGFAERYHEPEYPKFILFIDEIHTIMPKVQGSAYRGLSEVMKPYLTVGDLHVLGATTLDEYRWYIQEDMALDRRFQKIYLRMPTAPETYRILKNVRPGYEKHHRVTISDEALWTIVRLTDDHMRKRTQPDKSIISMDAAMAHHVKEHGIGGQVGMASVYYMIGREAGINPSALADDRLEHKFVEEVQKVNVELAEEDRELAEKNKSGWKQYQKQDDDVKVEGWLGAEITEAEAEMQIDPPRLTSRETAAPDGGFLPPDKSKLP